MILLLVKYLASLFQEQEKETPEDAELRRIQQEEERVRELAFRNGWQLIDPEAERDNFVTHLPSEVGLGVQCTRCRLRRGFWHRQPCAKG